MSAPHYGDSPQDPQDAAKAYREEHAPARRPITAEQAADYFDGKPLTIDDASCSTRNGISESAVAAFVDAVGVPAFNAVPPSYFYPLFRHMSQTHGLTLLDSDMEEICRVVESLKTGRAA